MNINEIEEIRKTLDYDESILLSFKPHKVRFVVINFITAFFTLTLFASVFIVLGILGLSGIIDFTNEATGEIDHNAPTIVLLVGCIPLLIGLYNSISYIFKYKNTMYVVTNKRIVIKSGFIGVDYKFLFLSQIGYIDVKVDFLDKIVRPNTGTIRFSSSALPISNNNNQPNNYPMAFQNIENPYDVYKSIKDIIATNV